MENKVALITGGGTFPVITSGIGLSVAKILSSRPNWTIHILDINEKAGSQVANNLPRTKFHHANITNYQELSTAFQNAFNDQGRLDFVFANAGVFERGNFHGPTASGSAEGAVAPPPEPDTLTIDLNLKGATFTSYLAQYYFRNSPHKGQGANLVITASCVGFYVTPFFPLYGASKYGVLGLMRCIAKPFRLEGIRINAICPGLIRTNLIDPALMDTFPQVFVDLDYVSAAVIKLLDGGDSPEGEGITDAWGTYVPKAKMFGLAVEISDNGNLYIRDPHAFADKGMEKIFGGYEMNKRVNDVLERESHL